MALDMNIEGKQKQDPAEEIDKLHRVIGKI